MYVDRFPTIRGRLGSLGVVKVFKFLLYGQEGLGQVIRGGDELGRVLFYGFFGRGIGSVTLLITFFGLGALFLDGYLDLFVEVGFIGIGT